MTKTLRYFFYIVTGAFVLLALFMLIRSFGGFSANSASAFEWQKQVNVYFGNNDMGSSEDCSKVFPISRTIINAETLGPGALEALILGVSEQDKTCRYFGALVNIFFQIWSNRRNDNCIKSFRICIPGFLQFFSCCL